MPLAPIARSRAPRRSAQTVVNNSLTLPASVGGLNFRDSIAAVPPTDAVLLTNFIVRPYGLQIRPGFEFIADGSEFVTDTIRTLMPYIGKQSAEDKLFAVAGKTIVNVGDASPTPADKLVSTASADGVWQYVNFANLSGNYLVAVNNGGGYWTYDPAGGWIERTPTGAWPATKKIVSVNSWKGRLWFVFADDTRAYYLDVGAITGAATAFDFGPQLMKGGNIAGIENWTLDSGVSIDDLLLVFGDQGNLIVYQGYDPSSVSTFQMKGIWDVGRVPVGHRFWSKYSGDVLIITELGIVTASRLVNGTDAQASGQNMITAKIQQEVSRQLTRTISTLGWELHVCPDIDSLLVVTPQEAGIAQMQWCMNNTTKAWSTFSGMPIVCGAVWRGAFYFGATNGRVFKAFNVATDAVTTTTSKTIVADFQSAFLPIGNGQRKVRFIQCRPTFVALAEPAVKVQVNTEFAIRGFVTDPTFSTDGLAIWDDAHWDGEMWGGASGTYGRWHGLQGTGMYGSIRLAVTGYSGTTLSSVQIVTEAGGVM